MATRDRCRSGLRTSARPIEPNTFSIFFRQTVLVGGLALGGPTTVAVAPAGCQIPSPGYPHPVTAAASCPRGCGFFRSTARGCSGPTFSWRLPHGLGSGPKPHECAAQAHDRRKQLSSSSSACCPSTRTSRRPYRSALAGSHFRPRRPPSSRRGRGPRPVPWGLSLVHSSRSARRGTCSQGRCKREVAGHSTDKLCEMDWKRNARSEGLGFLPLQAINVEPEISPQLSAKPTTSGRRGNACS